MANSKKPKPIPKDKNKVAMSIPSAENIKQARELKKNVMKITSRSFANEAIMALSSQQRTQAFIDKYDKTPQQVIEAFNKSK